MHPYFEDNYHYCPKCGSQLQLAEDGEHFVCLVCNFEVYPCPAPTVSIFFANNNQILLAKRAIDPGKGKWDSIGGFVEPGENFEQAAVREAQEETGTEIKVINIISSYPSSYEGKPTLNTGVAAEIISGEPEPADDVASLHWLDIDQLPEASEFAFKSVHQQLQDYINQLEKE